MKHSQTPSVVRIAFRAVIPCIVGALFFLPHSAIGDPFGGRAGAGTHTQFDVSPSTSTGSSGGSYGSSSGTSNLDRAAERAGDSIHNGLVKLWRAPGKALRLAREAKAAKRQQEELNRQQQLLSQQRQKEAEQKRGYLGKAQKISTEQNKIPRANGSRTLHVNEPPSPQIQPEKKNWLQRLFAPRSESRRVRTDAISTVPAVRG